jgi:hypothetical protein
MRAQERIRGWLFGFSPIETSSNNYSSFVVRAQSNTSLCNKIKKLHIDTSRELMLKIELHDDFEKRVFQQNALYIKVNSDIQEKLQADIN